MYKAYHIYLCKKIKSQKVHALLINARNANALTGPDGYEALKILSTLPYNTENLAKLSKFIILRDK